MFRSVQVRIIIPALQTSDMHIPREQILSVNVTHPVQRQAAFLKYLQARSRTMQLAGTMSFLKPGDLKATFLVLTDMAQIFSREL